MNGVCRGLLAFTAMAVAQVACVDREALVEPAPDPAAPPAAVRLRLLAPGDAPITIRRGAGMAIVTEGDGIDELWLEVRDERGEVLATLPSTGPARNGVDTVRLRWAALPNALPRAVPLTVLPAARVDDRTVYAGSDTVVASAADASAIRAVAYDGVRVPLGGGVRAMAATPGGRLYLADGRSAAVEVRDLATGNPLAQIEAPFVPESLEQHGSVIVAVGAGGAEAALLDAGSRRFHRAAVVPPLLVRVSAPAGADTLPADTAAADTTATDTVPADTTPPPPPDDITIRPYVQRASLGCAAAVEQGCTHHYLAGGSASTRAGEAGVVRMLSLAGPDSLPPAVAPVFDPHGHVMSRPPDSAAVRIELHSGIGTGADVIFTQPFASRCLTLSLGDGIVAASPEPGGPVFVAAGTAREPCGPGSRILRIDSPEHATPRLSLLAMRNRIGDDRVGELNSLRVAPGGAYLLAVGPRGAWVLDEMLRLRGSVPLTEPASAAWLQASPPALNPVFALATGGIVTLYRAASLDPVRELRPGPIEPTLLGFAATDHDAVVVALERGGDALILLTTETTP